MANKVAIVKGPRGLGSKYEQACRDLGVMYDIIDLYGDPIDWLYQLKKNDYQKVFVTPPCDTTESKLLYNDFLVVAKKIGISVYPSYESLEFYENKRLLAYLLTVEGYDKFPKTYDINSKEGFEKIGKEMGFKYVFKSIVGSGSASVYLVRSKYQHDRIAKKVFGNFHASLALGLLPKRRLYGVNLPLFGRSIKHACIMQEVCDFVHEWRVILIGDFCLAYKKLKDDNGFASGSKRFAYGLPPIKLVNEACKLSSMLNANSAAYDFFETVSGEYLINEVQANFGNVVKNKEHPNATMFDESGRPCILKKVHNSNWDIVYGEYCHNSCHNLKVLHALNINVLSQMKALNESSEQCAELNV